MPRKLATNIENNFTKGLLTEHTALNFPENACTETFNCVFDRTGIVSRRKGFDYEPGFTSHQIDRTNMAITTYIWKNAGGFGGVDLLVKQVGNLLHFYRVQDCNQTIGLSIPKLQSTVNLISFTSQTITDGEPEDAVLLNNLLFRTECQFAEGNGYLIVTNTYCVPFFCTFNSGTNTVIATKITIKIRDFDGVPEVPPLDDTTRPATLSDTHRYNLANQGWGRDSFAVPVSQTFTIGGQGLVHTGTVLTINSGSSTLPLKAGDQVKLHGYVPAESSPPFYFFIDETIVGTVTAYPTDFNGSPVGIQINVSSASGSGAAWSSWILTLEPNLLGTWFSSVGLYPSNADIWWQFKDSSGIFNPGATYGNSIVNSGPAPKGFHIIKAFRKERTAVSGVPGIGNVIANTRPRACAWFAGRIWYAGVDAGPEFSENIYFSQIVENTTQFGKCYQVNDPTSEDRFDLLPSDGGLIRIQGTGAIHKLFSIQTGVLVFAANGVWFIAGNQGVGFTANDYSISKLSAVRTYSHLSFVNVLGMPFWWNAEGIYTVSIADKGGFSIQSITDSTIAAFYADIPINCKLFARGDYNPLTQVIQWVYRSTDAQNIGQLVEFDRILNFNVGTGTFYPWTISTGVPKIHAVNYISNGSINLFKYLTSAFTGGWNFTFSEEYDPDYEDWRLASTPFDYVSYFITGYKLHAEAQRKFQTNYVSFFVDSTVPGEFFSQGVWDYSSNPNSGRWSTLEKVAYSTQNFEKRIKRVKMRGHGKALQIKITSSSHKPFDIEGWGLVESSNSWV